MAEDEYNDALWPAGLEPVAVLGVSFHFGGDAVSSDSFWDMLVEGRTARTRVPSERFNAEAFYHPDTNRLETLPVKHGNFIQEDISAFDAPFFGIKPAEAAAMDPQSRKLLEATYRALENAGIPLEMAMGTKTCVFTGISSDDYRLMYAKDPSFPIRHAATGMAPSMLANKISWFYDFKGPSVQLDTACSSSMVALHLAVRSIQSGESDMGIVGGANLWLTPESMLPLAHLNFLSPDSTCYSFDHRANGYARGDGYGVLVLKPLSEARAARDPIRAIIRSTASNENGRTIGGITKVSFEAQRAMIETAYHNANLDPALTRYVEAHAPGTEGDVVEASALAAVFREHRSTDDPLYMGSVKANLGHLEGASGIASLIKVILMLEKGIIPKLANLEQLHPRIRGDEWHMAFPTTNVPWPSGIRQASINSFGFGGANAHAVLQSERPFRPQREISQNTRSASTHPRLLVVSAADAAATDRAVSALHHYLKESKPLDHTKLQSIAYTLAHRRSRLPWKKAVVLSADTLSITNSPTAIRSMQEPVVVFVFTGQGVQWAQMGMQFLYNESFRTSLERSSEHLRELGGTWDAIEELSIEASGSQIDDATRAQPLCTAIQIALVDMLRSHGVRPAYCIGHSSGEIACAYLTGALSARSACQVAYHRGQLIARSFPLPGKYGMLAVGLSAAEVTGYLSRLDAQVETLAISIACYNSSRNITLSGERAQLEVLHGMFQAQSVFSRLLSVQAPYHTSILAHVASEYEIVLKGLRSGPQIDYSTVMVSSVTSQPISSDQLRTGAYWANNLIATVQFGNALQTLLSTALPPTSDSQAKTTKGCVIEIGPHGALRAPVKAHDDCRDLSYFSTMDRGTATADRLFETLGQLHCLGCPVDLMSVNEILEDEVACLTDLPQYPFNHSKRYWHESSISKSNRFRKYARHDFLGQRVLDWTPQAPRWRNCIRKLENPWIEDHKLGGALIYPGAGMLVMAIEAAAQYVRDQSHHAISGFQFTDVTLMSALNLTDSRNGTTTELSLDPSDERLGRSSLPKHFTFKLFVLEGETWRQVCRGSISVELAEFETSPTHTEQEDTHRLTLQRFESRLPHCKVPIRRHKLYQGMKKIGLDLGSTFHVLDNVKHDHRRGLAVADVRLQNWIPKGTANQVSDHYIHPTALDGLIQMLIVALGSTTREETPLMVPSSIGSLWLSAEGLARQGHITAISKSELYGLRHTTSEVLACDLKTKQVKVVIKDLQAIIIAPQPPAAIAQEAMTAFKMCRVPYASECSYQSQVPVLSASAAPSILIAISDTESASGLSHLALSVQRLLVRASFVNSAVTSWKYLMAGELAANGVPSHAILLHKSSTSNKDHASTIFSTFKRVMPLVRSLMWVTLADSMSPTAEEGLIAGLTRSLRNEYQDVPIVTLSIAHAALQIQPETAILASFQPARLLDRGAYEPEFYYELVGHIAALQVPRLHYSFEDAGCINCPTAKSGLVSRAFQSPGQTPIVLTVIFPGLLDSLVFLPDKRAIERLLPTQIRVRPVYVGLNFLDLLTALGRIPHNAVLGIEAAGIVTEAGIDTDLRPGNRVAVLTDGTFRSIITADYRTAVKLPNEVSLRDAASLTGTACTVYRAFVDIAQLQQGERVLIHAGAGATGQMAIQLAGHLGAEVFVTVSSNTKRQLIQNAYGIKPSNIFSSRDTSFVNGIKRLTGGQGVDVVLNSLTGELLASAWAEVIAPFGRWIEIGKRDMIDNNSLAMRPFLNNVSFSCVDLTGIWRQRAALMRRLLTDVFTLVTDGVLHAPKPLAKFGVHQVQAAFRRLQTNKDGGKVIVDMETEKEVIVQQPPMHLWNFRGDRSYLLAGGLGGLGREIARWMVRRGVRFLIVLSKSEPGKDETRLMLLDDLHAAECKVAAMMCDIADKDALEAALSECSTKLPPIAGCIQASMLLRDKYFSAMTINDWIECTAPKVEGTTHLDELLPTGLDFFIMLSSAVGVIGALGQSNYAAGCAFQDAITRHRVMRGEKAVSLDLGMIVDHGAVAEDDALARTMSTFGHYQPMTMDHLVRLLERYCDPRLPLLHADDCQMVCGIRPPAVVRAQGFKLPAWADMPLFESLHDLEVDTAEAPKDAVRRSCHDLLIGAASKQEAVDIVVTALLEKISGLLDVPPADISCTQPVHLYGVDSLIATELQNWFANQVKADVPILHILGNNSVEALATIAVDSRIPMRMPQSQAARATHE
ncbi:hypothetical protein LTR27_008674 [Elasticomyces elasticus]|nr:hypothetical protein LTR27_008674 [Elasticomyces elasticus]